MKIYWHDGGHITKMATMPIYSKNLCLAQISGERFTGTIGPLVLFLL